MYRDNPVRILPNLRDAVALPLLERVQRVQHQVGIAAFESFSSVLRFELQLEKVSRHGLYFGIVAHSLEEACLNPLTVRLAAFFFYAVQSCIHSIQTFASLSLRAATSWIFKSGWLCSLRRSCQRVR